MNNPIDELPIHLSQSIDDYCEHIETKVSRLENKIQQLKAQLAEKDREIERLRNRSLTEAHAETSLLLNEAVEFMSKMRASNIDGHLFCEKEDRDKFLAKVKNKESEV